jgi:hypothetical protein
MIPEKWTKATACLVLLLLSATGAVAQSHRDAPKTADRKFWALVAADATAKTWDMIETRQMLKRGNRETDPLFGLHPTNARLVTVSVGCLSMESLGTYQLKRLGQSRYRTLRIIGKFWWAYLTFSIEQHVRLTVHNYRLH